MSDKVIRPTQSPKEFYITTERGAEKEALGLIDPPEGSKPEEVRAAVKEQREKLLRLSLNAEIGNGERMAKRMMKLHKQTGKEVTKAERKLAKARTMAAAYPQDEQLEKKRAKAFRERHELKRKGGRAFQAAAEWQEHGRQLRGLIETGIERPARTIAGVIVELERGGGV